ncbi:HIT family protein [Candidatus Woesearchaeota archaeon]|nr:HIT family protein [Candidatus Woesearchaeota archaeon]
MTQDIPFTQEQLQRLTEISRLPPEEQKKVLPAFLKTLSPEQIRYLQEQQTSQQKTSCPFCLIVQKQVESVVLYEDDRCMAVFDIRPATKGHTLVFPKQHVADFSSLSEEQVTHLFLVSQKFGDILESLEGCIGVNLFVAKGRAAGQTVDHVLVHVIPRYTNDSVHLSWEGKQASVEELQQLTQQLAQKLTAMQSSSKEQRAAQQPSPPTPVYTESDEEPLAEF